MDHISVFSILHPEHKITIHLSAAKHKGLDSLLETMMVIILNHSNDHSVRLSGTG